MGNVMDILSSSKRRYMVFAAILVISMIFFLVMYTCQGNFCFTKAGTQSFLSNTGFMRDQMGKYSFNESDLHKLGKVDLDGNDVLVYLHIQKTGGATFGRHLVFHLGVNPPCKCKPHVKQCSCLTQTGNVWLFSRRSTGWVCGIHSDWTEMNSCMDKWFQKNDHRRSRRNYHFLTFLREPVSRFLSEWQHVQRGATWRNVKLRCNEHDATMGEVPFCYSGSDWKDVTLEEFVSCKHNLAFNRMTRMLADLTKVNCYNRTGLDPVEVDQTLLASAKENLLTFAFFGIVDYQLETQFLFERTFGIRFLTTFEQYKTTHVSKMNVTSEMRQQVAAMNTLDVQLYEFAKSLFFQRVRAMEDRLGYTVKEYFNSVRDATSADGVVIDEDDEGDPSNPKEVRRLGVDRSGKWRSGKKDVKGENQQFSFDTAH